MLEWAMVFWPIRRHCAMDAMLAIPVTGGRGVLPYLRLRPHLYSRLRPLSNLYTFLLPVEYDLLGVVFLRIQGHPDQSDYRPYADNRQRLDGIRRTGTA